MTEAQALHDAVMARLRELISWHRWYRRQPAFGYWSDLARDNDRELRALLRLAREARRTATAAPDPITLANGYRDWQPR